MAANMRIKTGSDNLPQQEFNGKIYKLYPGQRHYRTPQKCMHTAVWEYHFSKVPKGFVVHHKDYNPANNDISNLELISKGDHNALHNYERIKDNPDWFERFNSSGIAAATKYYRSPEGRKYKSEQSKRMWSERKPVKHTCQHCGSEYESIAFKTTNYCSKSCRGKANYYRSKLERECL